MSEFKGPGTKDQYMNPRLAKFDWLWMPLLVMVAVVGVWKISSSTWAPNLPSPMKTIEVSKLYLTEPFAKRGELDQGILRFTWYSLILVAKGYTIAILLGTPLGFLLGMSKLFTKGFDPMIQILRPVSLSRGSRWGWSSSASRTCSHLHDRHLLHVAHGLEHSHGSSGHPARLHERRSSPAAVAWDMLMKIMLPASLPYMFTGSG